MSKFKFLLVLVLVVLMGAISNVLAYNILHDIAPDSGQVITHAVRMTFTDVAGNISSATQPYITSTDTIAARYDFMLMYSDAGIITSLGETWLTDDGPSYTRHADSDPYRDTINGGTYYMCRQISPGETVVIPWGIINDSNDSTTNTFTITLNQELFDANYAGDSLNWVVRTDSDEDGAIDSDDPIFASILDDDAVGADSITGAVAEFDTQYMYTTVGIPPEALEGEGTLAIIIKATHSDPYSNEQQPDYLYLVQALEIAAPDMRMEKTVSLLTYEAISGNLKPGDTILYTLIDTNAGNGNAYNVNIEDTLPSWTYDGVNDTYVWLVKTYSGNDVSPDSTGNDNTGDDAGFDTILVQLTTDTSGGWTEIANAATTNVRTDDGRLVEIYSNVRNIRFFNNKHDARNSSTVYTYNKVTYYVMIPWVQE